MQSRSSVFGWLVFPFLLLTVDAFAQEDRLPVDARARELFKNLSDRFESLDALAVNTTTIIESKEEEDEFPVRQVLRQRLSFRRPDGLVIKRLAGSAPVTEVFYLKPTASLIIPGAGIIERKVGSLSSFLRSRNFGYERSSESNQFMDQNFAAVTIRDLLFRQKSEQWDEDIIGYEYLGQDGSGYGAVHGIRIFETHPGVGTVNADVYLTDGPRPRIIRIEPNVEHFKQRAGIEMDFRLTAIYDAWDFSPTLKDDVFRRPETKAKEFESVSSAIKSKLRARNSDAKMRERLVGKDVSHVELQMLDGTTLKIADLIGKQPILLDFWASWCSPCMQAFTKWQELLADERFADFKYVAVNQGESKSVVDDLHQTGSWKFPIAIDATREIGQIFEVNAIPQSVLIGKDGKIASVVFGLDDANRTSVTEEFGSVVDEGKTADQIVQQLRDRQGKVQSVVKDVFPAVVGLIVQGGGGSGVIVSKDGLVLTAAHVTNRAGEDVSVFLSTGELVRAKSLGADHRRDAAMLKLEGDREWPYVEISDDPLRLGEWVVAMGHPGGYTRHRTAPVRLGRVIKLADSDGVGKKFFATDCTITMGDSGGPAFDLQGRVIGIHSFISTRIEENMHVPMSAFRDGWDRMLNGDVWGRSQVADDGLDRAFFGVYLVPSDENGAVIEEVVDDGPADKAGIKAKDKIIAFGEKKDITNRSELREAKAQHRAGETVSVVVMRGDDRIEMEVELGKAE